MFLGFASKDTLTLTFLSKMMISDEDEIRKENNLVGERDCRLEGLRGKERIEKSGG